jgi:hypothetical protein
MLRGPWNRSGRREEEKILPLPGLELRFLGRLARSQSLYRWRYIGKFPGYRDATSWSIMTDRDLRVRFQQDGTTARTARTVIMAVQRRLFEQRHDSRHGDITGLLANLIFRQQIVSCVAATRTPRCMRHVLSISLTENSVFRCIVKLSLTTCCNSNTRAKDGDGGRLQNSIFI